MLWGDFGRRYSSAAASQASTKLFLPQLPNVKARSSVLLRERVILRVGGGASGVLLYSKLSFCCHSDGARHG